MSMQQEEENQIGLNSQVQLHLRDYLAVVMRHWRPALLVGIALVTLGSFISFHLPNKYRSSTTVQLNNDDETMAVSPFERTFQAEAKWLSTELQIIQSEAVLGAVVDKVALVEYLEHTEIPSLFSNLLSAVNIELASEPVEEETLAEKRTKAIKFLKEQLSVSAPRDTNLVEIEVSMVENEVLPAAIANEIVNAYNNFKVESNKASLMVGVKELGHQLKKQEVILAERKAIVSEIQQRYQLTALPGEMIQTDNADEIRRLKGLLAEAKVELDVKEALSNRMEQMKDSEFEEAVSVILGSGEEYLKLKNALNEAEVEYNQLAVEYGDKHPMMVKASRRLEVLQRQMSERIGGLKGGIQAELQKAEAKVKSLTNEIAKMESAYAGDYAQQISEFNQAVKDYKEQEELVTQIRGNYKEEMISLQLPKSTIACVLREAEPAMRPFSPSQWRNRAIILFLAAAASVGLCFLLEYFRCTITTLDELESVWQMEVLAVAPRQDGRGFTKKGRKRQQQQISELFRQLKNNLMYNIGSDAKVVGVQSTVSGEGKTTITYQLALAMAEAGQRVIIVDADMYKTNLFKLLNMEPAPGLYEYLQANDQTRLDDFVRPTKVENLDLLGNGRVKHGAYRLFNQQCLSTLFEQLKKSYDVVLVDTPPVLAVSESLTVSRCVDANMYVVEYDRCRRFHIRHALNVLDRAGCKLCGFTLNKVNVSKDHYYRNYYYSYADYTGYTYQQEKA